MRIVEEKLGLKYGKETQTEALTLCSFLSRETVELEVTQYEAETATCGSIHSHMGFVTHCPLELLVCFRYCWNDLI